MSGASQAHEANAPAATHGHTGLAHAVLEESWPGDDGDAATSLEEVESEEEAGGEAASNDDDEDFDRDDDEDFDRNEDGGSYSDDSDGSTWAVAAQAAAASAAVGAAMAAAGAAAAAAEAAMTAADAPRPGPPSQEPVEPDLTRASATADAAAPTALAAQPVRQSAVSLTALFDSGPDPHRGATGRGANRASGEHSVNPGGGETSAFMSLHDITSQALSAGGHVAMEIGRTTSARQARTGPPPGAPPPPGATRISHRGTYPTVYPAAYSTATAVTACPDEVPLAEASVVWQGFSPDGFGEVAPGYALASAAPKGRRWKQQSAARSDAHGNHWQCTHGPLSVDEAWRDQDHQDRVTSARQQAEAEGLVLQSSAQSASGYKGVAINKLPHGEKDRPRPYQAYVVRGEKKMHLGSFAVPEEAALAVARELAAEAAWAAQNPLSVAPSVSARAPAAQSEPAPPPPPLAPGTKVAIRGLTGRYNADPTNHPTAPNPNPYPLTP